MRRLAATLAALAAVGILAAAAGWVLWTRYERGRYAAYGSSHRSDEDGIRALYLLLQESGHDVRRLRRPVPPPGGVLVCVEPVAVQDAADDALVEWVEAGGTLVLVPSLRASYAPMRAAQNFFRGTGQPLTARFGLGLSQGEAKPVPAAGVPLDGAALARDRVEAFWTSFPPDAQVHLGTRSQAVLVEVPRGRGRVLAFSDAAWFGNARIAEGERLPVALWLLTGRGEPVHFDEYRHGLAERPGLAYVLHRYGLLPAAFAAIAFLAMLAWRATPREAQTASGEDAEAPPVWDSLAEARAGLYERTLRPASALSLLAEDLRPRTGRAGPGASRTGAAAEREALRKELSETLERARRSPPPRLGGVLALARRVAAFEEGEGKTWK